MSLPPLGRSDHSMVYLQPTYRPCVQRLPVTTRSFRKWSPEVHDALRDCFDVTDWAVLLEEEEMDIDMDRRVSTITDYINFCRDTVIPVRTVRCYPNNKPWITSDIKDLLNQKKMAFQNGDGERRRNVQRELKKTLRQAKVEYKKKVERQLENNNTEEVLTSTPCPSSCCICGVIKLVFLLLNSC